jgi:hypothetical protein
MLPHEVPFEVSAWPHRFIGSLIPDRPLVYLDIPTSLMIYRNGYSPAKLYISGGKWCMAEKPFVVEAFVAFVLAWYDSLQQSP